jgi:hypothetical protein
MKVGPPELGGDRRPLPAASDHPLVAADVFQRGAARAVSIKRPRLIRVCVRAGVVAAGRQNAWTARAESLGPISQK